MKLEKEKPRARYFKVRITKTKLDGALIITPSLYSDERGWFIESYRESWLKDVGVKVKFVQENHSYSAKKGTLRGLHIQKRPHDQAKLIRCTRGAILDVIVDLRKKSPTYRKWEAVELSDENKKQLFIPRGFAHGFVTLKKDTEIEYKVDRYYAKDFDRSIRYDDPEIAVDWKIKNPILSKKDQNAPLLKDSDII